MKERIHYREESLRNYKKENVDIAREFAKQLYDEFGSFISALVLFGSTARKQPHGYDIDILIVLDDVKVVFTRELVETYRIITEKVMARVSPEKLHIHSMTLTSFWEYVRAGDPVAINILRDGVSLVDQGFFDPLKILLAEGRIRPSEEAIYTYYNMSPASLFRAKQHLLQAGIDLYWSVIDAAHAALMSVGEVPPGPDHITEVFEKRLVKTKHISGKYLDILHQMYLLSKQIIHREKKDLTGKEYDSYRAKADDFVREIKKYLERK
ncbi:MAG: nucleotidyltransferase domain-containing protein [Candidatus Woesearchaeota archaeon]|nr:MAG: nucleotidyltransferase domain-containing protein [Candidatus Woesearchaeota archaeon]